MANGGGKTIRLAGIGKASAGEGKRQKAFPKNFLLREFEM
jgi:hypothetical protein